MLKVQPIPNSEKIVFKEKFQERYSELTDWKQFKTYSLSFLRRSIRVNTLKGSVKEITASIKKKGWKLTKIPWCKDGFWLENPQRKDVGNLLEHHLGKIYVQEAASMIPPLVLQPQSGELVLDMAAAPGSKTTQMGAMMNNQGLIIANDYKGSRLSSLGLNVQRSGLTNVLITLMDGLWFKDFQFDKILLDAPCSGTGTIRKSLKTISIWNEGMIQKISRQQIRLAETAFHNLKPGGLMVYSTCSLEPEENESVVDHLLKTFPNADVLKVELPGLKTGQPIMEFGGHQFDKRISRVLRIWPQDNNTEGFFVAKIKKVSD